MTSPATQPSGSVRRAEAGLRLAGRYELQHPIAAGGMAQVWAAHDHVLGRRVAVKILHPHLATDDSFLRRFRLEAQAAARLRHPSIVAIYDTVTEPGIEAIVMELCDGPTLRQLMDERGQLALGDVIDVASQVAEALDVAHRGGVVHRDIKPSNILVGPGGRIVVTDFGIAKAGEDADLTRTGTLLGTAKYLAPEQLRGEPIDPRADLYSLGVVMFEALCGRPPFLADNEAGTALARLHHDPPAPRGYRPEIPRALERIVLKALAREPDDRWSRATELRAALTQVRWDEADDDERPTVIATRPADLSPPPPGDGEQHGFLRSERSWLLPALLVVLTAAALAVSGALFSQTSLGRDLFDRGLGRQSAPVTVPTTPTVPAEGQALDKGFIESARTFDPLGDGGERDEYVGRAVDDDPASFWPTETYDDPDLSGGGFKEGVGLVVELDGDRSLSQLDVRTVTEGWRAEIYVGDGGDELDDWGEPVAAAEGLGSTAAFDLSGQQGSAVLIWITHTGRSPTDSGWANRTQITDLRVA